MQAHSCVNWRWTQNARSAGVLVLLIAAAVILYLLNLESFPVGGWGDDAHYITLARSLASGHGYNLISYPNPQAELAFPPGYPVLLSPLVRLWPNTLLPLKVASVLFILGSAIMLVKILAARLINREMIFISGIVGLYVLHPLIVGLSGQIMSESAYLLFTFLALWICVQMAEQPSFRHKILSAALLAVVSAIVVMVRTAGFSLILSIVVWLLLTRNIRLAGGYICMVLLCLVPLFALNVSNGGGLFSPTYTQARIMVSFGQRAHYLVVNFVAYVIEILPTTLVPAFGPRLGAAGGLSTALSIIKLIITAVACVGLVARLKTITVVDVYFVIYFGLLLQDTIAGNAQGRFIIPILPFLLFYFLYGADRILHVATSRLIQSRAVVGRAISLLVVGLLALYLVRDIQQIAVPVRNRMTDLSVGAVWIKANTNDNAVVMCSDAVSRYLYLERPTVDFPRTDGPEELLNTIRRENVSFLLLAPKLAAQRSSVLDEHVKQAILPTLQANPEQFMLVYEEPTHALLVYKMTTQPSDVEQLP